MRQGQAHLGIADGRRDHAFPSGIFGNLGLAALKLLTALLWSSRLFAVDGLYSLVTAIAFLIPYQAAMLERKRPSEQYPYGATKLLFLSVLAIGAMYLFVAVPAFLYTLRPGIQFQAGRTYLIPVVVAAISIVANEVLYQTAMGRDDSGMVASVRWVALNNRAGVAVSALVLLSSLLSRFGMGNFATVTGIAASIPVALAGLRMVSASFHGIMDKGPTGAITARIASCADGVEGVQRVVDVKARCLGRGPHMDVWVALDEDLKMSQVERIMQEVEERVRSTTPQAKFVNVIVA